MRPQPDTPGGQAKEADGDVCGCVTCGDVADPMRVVKLDEVRELALCEDESGQRHTVEILLVQPVAEGDELLVHAGTAIARATPAGKAERVAV